MKSLKRIFEAVADKFDCRISFETQKDYRTGKSEKYVTISCYSDAGEDLSFEMFYNKLSEIPGKVQELADDFDIDQHVYELLEAKRNGFAGVPDAETLVQDAKSIKQFLKGLAAELQNATERNGRWPF